MLATYINKFFQMFLLEVLAKIFAKILLLCKLGLDKLFIKEIESEIISAFCRMISK